jgi:hypothetical protein
VIGALDYSRIKLTVVLIALQRFAVSVWLLPSMRATVCVGQSGDRRDELRAAVVADGAAHRSLDQHGGRSIIKPRESIQLEDNFLYCC